MKKEIKQKIKERIADALIVLENEQLPDGSFLNLSSPTADMRHPATKKTVFVTALIVSSLENVQANVCAKKIIRDGIAFLLREKSPDWSWNYWPRNVAEKNKKQKIPDDMDDTFAALLAFAIHNPDLIDAAALASIRRHLRQTRHILSGLHNTWIVDYRENPRWDDTDIVINATVGHFLKRRGVDTSEIEEAIKNSLQHQLFKKTPMEKEARTESAVGPLSRYYSSPVVVMYFLARLFGARLKKMKFLMTIPDAKDAGSALEIALSLTALIRMETRKKKLAPYVSELLRRRWTAHALYTESVENKIPRYAGAEALTAAFCIEALSAYMLYEDNSQYE